MQIQLLPEHVANQIAAGEVVEGPISVVKELVENSIDAGSTRINIEIKNSNRSIKVSDNGKGIAPDDIDLAFKRHATSKIVDIEDLLSLSTNGFRGEALASIASVSKLTCISKRTEDEHASKLYLENGQDEKTITGAANGTSIHVDDLFFNTPARLKFLKSTNKERNNIIDIVRSLALAHSQIAFELLIDNKSVFKTNGSGDLKQVISEIFSKDIAKDLNEIKYNQGDIEVTGYCASPHITRSDKRGIFTIVNNRSLKCYVINSAINAVFKELIPAAKYPIAVVFLNLASDAVDVNVHPTKKEVKYKEANKIYTAVGDAVSSALSQGFYEKNFEYQPALKEQVAEYQIASNPAPSQPRASLTNSESKTHEETETPEFKLKPALAVEQNTEQKKISLIAEASEDAAGASLEEEKISIIDKKFISRLGSVDISVLGPTDQSTLVSQQGNKTNYEIVAKDQEASKAVLLKGSFIGENWIKDKYLAFLNGLAEDILTEKVSEQKQIFANENKKTNRSRPNKKPPMKTLEKIWDRDNYTCVYCTKPLLHPSTVRDAQPEAEAAFKTYLNKDNKEVTVNILDTHTATYDHHLPASKFGVLNTEEENLYAACIECNKQKSDSLAKKTWQPVRADAWAAHSEDKPLEIAGLRFGSAQEFSK